MVISARLRRWSNKHKRSEYSDLKGGCKVREKEDKTTYVKVPISKTIKMRLKNVSASTGLPMSTIVGLALDAEMERNPRLSYDLTLPDNYIEYAFAAEAGRILDYIKKLRKSSISIDFIYMLRHDIGVTDKEKLLGAFRELIEKEFLVEVKAPFLTNYKYPDDYKFYGVPRTTKESKEEREYKQYLKLQEKFDKNTETK